MKIEVKDFNDIADEIRNIAQAMQALKASRLKEEAIVILVQKLSGENKTTIKNVLYGLGNLSYYVKG